MKMLPQNYVGLAQCVGWVVPQGIASTAIGKM